MWTNSRNFHNVPIPYEFSNIADLCMNNGYPYDGYVDFMLPENEESILLDRLINAETLVHCRIQSACLNRRYNLKLSLCCTIDHTYYRLYYVVDGEGEQKS